MPMSLSRRAALSLFGGTLLGGAFLRDPALAASAQCGHISPVPFKAPPVKGPTLGDLARAKGLMLGIQASIPSNQEYGKEIYDEAYMKLVLAEKPDYLAFGGQFNFGNVASDPPSGTVLNLTNATYNITNTWFNVDDVTPTLQAAHIGARADALIWDSDQVRQPWLRPIPRGASPDRKHNRDLDWNIARAEDFIRIAFDKFDELNAGDPGYVKIVSLVNEPLDSWGVPGQMAYRGGRFIPEGVALDAIPGVPDYIRDLYTLAGKLRGPRGPNKPVLILNDAGMEHDQGGALVRASLLKLLKKMQAEGIPLDGLGIEGHLQPQMMNDPWKPDWSAYGAFLDEVADLGLDIHVTELDVFDFATSCDGRPGRPAESDKLVALYFETFLTRTLQCKAVKAVTFWDLSDRYSFYRYMDVNTWFGYDQIPRGQRPADWPNCARMPMSPAAIACPRPAVYDDRYQPKLARAAIVRALEAAPAR